MRATASIPAAVLTLLIVLTPFGTSRNAPQRREDFLM